jgi:hypothetical protein
LVILNKGSVYARVLFRKVYEIELFKCTVTKLLIRKQQYVLFLISVFIVKWQIWYSLPSTTVSHVTRDENNGIYIG